MVDWRAIMTGVGMAIGAVVWFVRLEGRVNTLEALQGELRDDVKYIRGRIDAALSAQK